jgi:signal transduction histidine kinase
VSAVTSLFSARFASLARRADDRLVAGVCSGLARAARVDPTLLRLVFALLAFARGAGIAAYFGVWLALPTEGQSAPGVVRRTAGLLALAGAGVLAVSSLGISDWLLWPVAIVGLGVVIALDQTPLAKRTPRTLRWVVALALVLLGVVLFLRGATESGTYGSLVAPTGLGVVLFLVVGPWMWRLVRERDAERTERIRAQERAEMAARVHDSVLQTLALVQRNADDPRRVGALARRQERELRAWLYPQGGVAEGDTLRGALEEAVADLEELHGVRVDLVQTGDRGLDERLRALVLATREAVANAAAHAGVDEVSVFVDVGEREVAVYVRDRGSGFDRAAVPADRRGLSESIEGRVTRQGGTAVVRSAPGEGTEVELRLPFPEEP